MGRSAATQSREDVRDLHLVIVHHCSQMIGGQAIRFQQDIIIEILVLGNDITAQVIMRGRRSFIRHLETDNIFFAGSDAPGRFIRVQPTTEPIVTDALDLTRFLLLAHLVETFRRAKTGISSPFSTRIFA